MTPAERAARKQAEDDRHRPTPPTVMQQECLDLLALLTDEELNWLEKEIAVVKFERKLKR
jgi:hypothetical protein